MFKMIDADDTVYFALKNLVLWGSSLLFVVDLLFILAKE